MYSKFGELVKKIKIKEDQQDVEAPASNDQDWWIVVFVFTDTRQCDSDRIHLYMLHSRTLTSEYE